MSDPNEREESMAQDQAFDALVSTSDRGEVAMQALREDLHNAGCRGDMLGQIEIRAMMQRVEAAMKRRDESESGQQATPRKRHPYHDCGAHSGDCRIHDNPENPSSCNCTPAGDAHSDDDGCLSGQHTGEGQVTDEQINEAAFDYCKWPKEEHSRIAFGDGAKWALSAASPGETK